METIHTQRERETAPVAPNKDKTKKTKNEIKEKSGRLTHSHTRFKWFARWHEIKLYWLFCMSGTVYHTHTTPALSPSFKFEQFRSSNISPNRIVFQFHVCRSRFLSTEWIHTTDSSVQRMCRCVQEDDRNWKTKQFRPNTQHAKNDKFESSSDDHTAAAVRVVQATSQPIAPYSFPYILRDLRWRTIKRMNSNWLGWIR